MEKAKTRKEIASEFGITPKTLRIWLLKAEITLDSKSFICPKTYKIIKEKFYGT
jgi:predicted transcriptional regulator